MTLILFLIGLVLLIVGADLLVKGASKLAIALGISPLVVGLTVVAFGTSSPELAVLLQASLSGNSDIAIGNVVGSNIANILVVLGLSAIVAPLVVSKQLLRFDLPIMVGISFLLFVLAMDRLIGRADGVLLFVGIIAYMFWSIRRSRQENMKMTRVSVSIDGDLVAFVERHKQEFLATLSKELDVGQELIRMMPVASDSLSITLQMPYAFAHRLVKRFHEIPAIGPSLITAVEIPQMAKVTIHIEEETASFSQDAQESFVLVVAHTLEISPELIRMMPVEPDSHRFTLEMPREAVRSLISMCKQNDPELAKLRFLKVEQQKLTWLKHIAFIVGGLGMLVLGSRWLVNGAVTFATWLGLSQLVIGLTIVAIGTSLPEIATSIVAGKRGEGDIVVGNVVGSNIFNILLVLGLCSIIAPVEVSSIALNFDIPVMLAIALICLPVFYSEWKVERWEGFLFAGYYVAYTVYLILSSTNSSYLAPFMQAMTVVIPFSLVVLFALLIRTYFRNANVSP
jgi:K+-dependent Na+/Ca+ exchanger-like protein